MFIEATNAYNEEKQYIGVYRIISFGHSNSRDGTFIWFGGDDIIHVNESVEEIKKKIIEAQVVLQ